MIANVANTCGIFLTKLRRVYATEDAKGRHRCAAA